MVNIAPVCRAKAAVWVCVRLKTGHSGVWCKKLGVVSDAPAAVVSVDVNAQFVKSASALHGPCSRIWNPHVQSPPRVIVFENEAGTILMGAM